MSTESEQVTILTSIVHDLMRLLVKIEKLHPELRDYLRCELIEVMDRNLGQEFIDGLLDELGKLMKAKEQEARERLR